MLFGPRIGYFVLADISGFTAYLAGVEIDHASGVLRDLLERVVAAVVPPLSLASVEGDAIFAFLPAERLFRGETLLELFETAYHAFRAHQETVARRTTCGCQACLQIPKLDLKFIVHSGEYRLQRVSGRVEPLGLAADLVRRRALKPPPNGAPANGAAAPESRGYAMFTSDSLNLLGLPPEALGGQREEILVDEVGSLAAYRLDLHARYQATQAGGSAFVGAQSADAVVVRDLPAAPAVVWEWLNDPARRSRWMAGRSWHAGARPAGRTSPGARNHCDHGFGAVIETVLDWQPFDSFTVELVPRGGGLVIHQSYQLEALPGGPSAGPRTRLRGHVLVQPPTPRWLGGLVGRFGGGRLLRADLARLARLLESEAAPEN